MKSNFSYNLLKHLRRKQAEGGFTLIELLVVIIIIGILAAIALPSFLNQANRARETEATNAIGALNRGQQAYYLEAVEYAPEVDNLDVGVETDSENFNFGDAINLADGAGGIGNFKTGLDTGNGAQGAAIYAVPVESIRGFAGSNYVTTTSDGTKTTTEAILCREKAADAKTAGVVSTVDETNYNACGADLEPVN